MRIQKGRCRKNEDGERKGMQEEKGCRKKGRKSRLQQKKEVEGAEKGASRNGQIKWALDSKE